MCQIFVYFSLFAKMYQGGKDQNTVVQLIGSQSTQLEHGFKLENYC